MSSKRRIYPREFKEEAVRLAHSSSKPTSELEDELGITRGLLGKWKRALSREGEEAFRGQGRRSTTEEEVEQLRREKALLTQERDILKKALAIFTRSQR
jgi:transposase